LKEKDEKKFGSEKEMSLSLQPGLNEALYRILQRIFNEDREKEIVKKEEKN
jgi:hypothetical protein